MHKLKHKAVWIAVGSVLTAVLIIGVMVYAYAQVTAVVVDQWGWIGPAGIAGSVLIAALANGWVLISNRRVASKEAAEIKQVTIASTEKVEKATQIVAEQVVAAEERTDEARNIVAEKAEEVRAVLKESTSATDKKLNEIHGLVNGSMKMQLELYAVLARRHADTTGLIADAKVAELAEEKLAAHKATEFKVEAEAAEKKEEAKK